MNGVLNLIAFIALLVVGAGHLTSGWTLFGGFLLGLGALTRPWYLGYLDLSTQPRACC
jgi:hypothetical protein